jgi:prepilin-type N-terminal cleavage/methylation domain-containing protein
MSPSRSSRRRPSRGFTLIELLVVIAIIAVLVTSAFLAFGPMLDKAKETETRSMARAIVTAVEQFESDYDRLPEPSSATKNTDCESDTTAAEGLMAILMGVDKTQNPRGKNYPGDLKDAKRTDKGPRDGLVRDGETLALVDQWGQPYKVLLDLDHDGILLNPNQEEADKGLKELHKRVLVYSAGKDKDYSTWKDNVTSWSAQ